MQEKVRVLINSDKDVVLKFERDLLNRAITDEFEREMASWNALWRPESLDHYLMTGWSGGIWSESGELLGYFLGQALMFYQGLTQVLWVEHLAGKDSKTVDSLKNLAVMYAKDKHLQSVFFYKLGKLEEIKTTKRG